MKILLIALMGFIIPMGDLLAVVKLPAIFGDDMVLQRNKPIIIWGWASAGEEVAVMINGKSDIVMTSAEGKWKATLPPMEAGGPYELSIRGENEVVLENILIGDIWICGGQSNMQWRVDQTNFSETDTSFLKKSQLRLFTVHPAMDYMPKDDLKGTGWKTLTRKQLNAFSAVAYHFGKYIEQHINIPVGLISNNLGATSVETWMSNEALQQFPQFEHEVGPIVEHGKNFDALYADFKKLKPLWYEKHYYRGVGVAGQWYRAQTEITDWKNIKIAGNTWEEQPVLKNHDGAVWFRTSFDLPEGYDQKTFHLGLLQIDDYDITWVNGIKVGETYGNHNHRNYTIQTKHLKPRGNVLVVRVFDVGGVGGFTTSPFWGNNILRGEWLYKKGRAIDAGTFPKPVLPNASPFSSPGVLFNANIAPLTSLPVKGVIWYQGESNANRAYEYRKLFPALIKDWRTQWDQEEMPFLFVQLANYKAESDRPQESEWAELREAQAMALQLPHTAMAVAIDIGEANNIHPENKEDVGQRLGLAALKVAYGKDIVAAGPTFKNMIVDEHEVLIEFTNIGKKLVSKDKYGYVRGFQVAGEDRKFYWAKARITGNTVILRSKKVDQPVAVRYAWSDNPGQLDLYNEQGLPAVPFRTDDWKGITEGNLFSDGPRF